MNKPIEELRQATTDTFLTYIGSGDDSVTHITHDETAISDAFNILNLTDRIIKSNTLLYTLKENKKSSMCDINMTKLGKDIIQAIYSFQYYIPIHLNHHRLHPSVELFLKYAKKLKLETLIAIQAKNQRQYTERYIRILNYFVSAIRKHASTGKLAREINNFQRSAKKNNCSLMRYINKIFDSHSRLLVLRIDVGYLSDSKSEITAKTVQEHRNKFFANTRSNSLFTPMLGYAWKLEYGLEKGFHYHMLFLFDGSMVREDVNIARQIGEYWSSFITDGKGVYFNCNRIKNSYKSCGIGMVNHYDVTLRDGLKNAALYMIKTDNFIKLALPGNARTFGKGEISRPKLIKRGRPRIKSPSQH